MRSLLDWYFEWHPPIMHDLHQAQTLLYTFSGQAPQNPNLDPILYGGTADDGELRDGTVCEVRHARRLDARVRGHVVAGVSRVHVVESQRHDPDVRDSGIQRGEHAEDAPGESQRCSGGHRTSRRRSRRGRSGRPGCGRGRARQSECSRMVPALARDGRIRLVAAQQHELRRNGRHHGAPVHVAVPENHPRKFLREVAQLDGGVEKGWNHRLHHPRRTARHDARRPAGQLAAPPGHRDRPHHGRRPNSTTGPTPLVRSSSSATSRTAAS